MAGAKVTVFTSEDISADREVLRQLVTRIARGAWSDFKMTNKSTAGKASKTAASLAVGSAVAQALETLTPLQWAVRGFGPLPMEFTKSGAIHVFEFTTLERALKVANRSREVHSGHDSVRRWRRDWIAHQSDVTKRNPGRHRWNNR
jgi:hypothetical protein